MTKPTNRKIKSDEVPNDIRQCVIKDFGSELADNIYRDADSGLFANPPDILMLIKLRELYGWLEETVDACKDVAQVISEIVIKGS